MLGSSSLLATDRSLGDSGQPLELSMDADLLLIPFDDRIAAVVHEAVGEDSLFHREFGVFSDLLRPDIEATLPAGWRDRLVPLPGIADVRCLHSIDLAAVKLRLGRPKDMALLRAMLDRGLVRIEDLRAWYGTAGLSETDLFAISHRLAALSRRP